MNAIFRRAFPLAAFLLSHWWLVNLEPFGWDHPVSWPKLGLCQPHSGSHRKSHHLQECAPLQKYPLCDLLTPLSPAISTRSCNYRMDLLRMMSLAHLHIFPIIPKPNILAFLRILLQAYRCLETEFLYLCVHLHFHGKCIN